MVLAMAQADARAQLPTITNQPASRALWAGGSVEFAVGVSGAGPFTYQWLLNGTNLPNGVLTTVAGNGAGTYSGDGGPAINASLYSPQGVAVDAAGNLFIADYYNNRVRKVSTNGLISTVAGGGNGGDGGLATNASLGNPASVALDGTATLFIADYYNSRIRAVGTNGIISTVAGTGTRSYSGDGGPATDATFTLPTGLALDGLGNLFIAAPANQCVRAVNTDGVIQTVAGIGTNSSKNGAYSGDGGVATNASLNGPSGVGADSLGNLFIADNGNNRIRKVDTSGIITTVAGNGTAGYSGDGAFATNASLQFPDGVAVDSLGDLFIADTGNNLLREVTANGIITTVAGNGTGAYSGDGGPATNASLFRPRGVTVDSSGNLFIADSYNNRIRKVTNTQGPVLALNNVSAPNAGSYQVVVTRPGGSVTSGVARLVVADSPLICQAVWDSGGNVALSCLSQPGSTNTAQWATNLAPPVFWQLLSTNLAGPDGTCHFTDTTAANCPGRFYRFLKQ